MSSMSGETDPSENRAAARPAAAGPLPSQVTFNRFELSRILNLYGRMVADGEWRDYAIDFLRDRAVFSVFRRAGIATGLPRPSCSRGPLARSCHANDRRRT